MQFSFDKEAMTREISIAQEIITNKSAQSVLSNVLLEAKENALTIKATDSAVNFVTRINVDVHEEGSVIVYCDKFMSILQSLPAGDVDFGTENNEAGDLQTAVIRPVGRKVKFALKCMSADKFPPIPEESDAQFFEISGKDFKAMIAQTIFAVSNDMNRYFMTGVYFAKEEDKLVMVATDGRRLALMQKYGIDCNFAPAIVPTKVLSCILHTAPSEGNISIAVTEKMMFAKFGGYEFSSALIDGDFPNYHKVIPETQSYYFKVSKEDFDTALKRMMIMIDKRSSRLLFKVTPGMLTIFSPDTEFGTSEEEIPCEYDGEEVTIALNCHFLAEPLKVMDAQNIVIEFTEHMKAITFKEDGEEDCFHVIMPMNL